MEGARSRRSVHVVPGSSERFLAKAAQLDADPEILWAGGLPYDLRASVDEPAVAAGF